MIYIAVLINPTGDTYEVAIEAPDYQSAVEEAKRQYSFYVQYVKHTPENG